MPAYTSFAVAGAGNLGQHIAHALLKRGFQVTVLSRSSTGAKAESLKAAGVRVQAVDYSDAASVAKAIAGSQVVINSLGFEAALGIASDVLVEESKKQGTQLYVPNDWGFDYAFTASKGLETHPINVSKPAVTEHLKKIGLPYLQFWTGPFASFLSMLFSIDKDAGTAKIFGQGNTPFASTAEKDVGDFVAKAFATLPRSELENTALSVTDSLRYTANELVAAVGKRIGKEFKIERLSVEQAKAQIADMSSGSLIYASFIAWVQLNLELGGGSQKDDNERVGFESSVDLIDVILAEPTA